MTRYVCDMCITRWIRDIFMSHSFLIHDAFILIRDTFMPHSWPVHPNRDTFIPHSWRISVDTIHMCDMTHSCAWGTCHLHMCDIMCDTTHSYIRHDSFACVTWRIHMRDMTHSCSWGYDSFVSVFICVAWHVHMRHMTHSYLRNESFVCQIQENWNHHPIVVQFPRHHASTCIEISIINNATHYVKLCKKRRKSSRRNYYIISPRMIIKAIIIIYNTLGHTATHFNTLQHTAIINYIWRLSTILEVICIM